MRVFGREKERAIEKEIEGNELRITRGDYIGPSKSRHMQVLRGIETAVEEGIEEMVVNRYKYRGGVKEQSIRCKNRSSIYPPAVEKLSRRQELSRCIHQVSRRCRDCDMKQLKKLDRQQGIKEVSSQFLKAVFQEVKNINLNAIQHATQPMIQTPYKSLKINSQKQF